MHLTYVVKFEIRSIHLPSAATNIVRLLELSSFWLFSLACTLLVILHRLNDLLLTTLLPAKDGDILTFSPYVTCLLPSNKLLVKKMRDLSKKDEWNLDVC